MFAFKANFRDATLAEGLLPVLSFSGGYGGMVIADQHVLTLACCIRGERLAELRRAAPGSSAGEVIEAMLRQQCRGVARALHGAQREGAWLSSGPLAPGIRLRRDDALFRIGNAAGEAHPLIGEGMSMAIQSAALLSAHLLSVSSARRQCGNDWQREAQRRYQADWRRHFAARLRLAALFANVAERPALSKSLALWPALGAMLLTHGTRWAGKLRCAVDPSALIRTLDAYG